MIYNCMSGNKSENEFYKKKFDRSDVSGWDLAWSKISPSARRLFLEQIPPAVRSEKPHFVQPSVATRKLPAEALGELVENRFVILRQDKGNTGELASVNLDAYDFDARIRCLMKSRVLFGDAKTPVEVTAALVKYLETMCSESGLRSWASKLLNKQQIEDGYGSLKSYYPRLMSYRWPLWVADAIPPPLAAKMVERFLGMEGPVSLIKFLAEYSGPAASNRKTLDALANHLAIYEDLDPATYEIMVGLHPNAVEGYAKSIADKVLRELVPKREFVEFTPIDGFEVSDVREMLMELSSAPMRLKQDGSPFAKEYARFNAVFHELPKSIARAVGLDTDLEIRLNRVYNLVEDLGLGDETDKDEGPSHFRINRDGKAWLSLNLYDQQKSLCDFYRGVKGGGEGRFDRYGDYDDCDSDFLGKDYAAVYADQPERVTSRRLIKPADRASLRESLDRVLRTMPEGNYYTLPSFLDRFSHPKMSPFLLDCDPKKVVLFRGHRRVPLLPEEQRDFSREALEVFVFERLVVVGALHAGITSEGEVCLARTPLYDAYFGHKVNRDRLADLNHSPGSSRVVVQPDFSIVVIGPNPLPLSELIPFCERTTKTPGQGAVILKLSQDSVNRALGHGLSGKEIIARLDKYAGETFPANVKYEVRQWADRARKVYLTNLTVCRCPDKETADRLMGALKCTVERINDVLLGVDPTEITPAIRKKLQGQGLFLEGELKPVSKASKKKHGS